MTTATSTSTANVVGVPADERVSPGVELIGGRDDKLGAIARVLLSLEREEQPKPADLLSVGLK